MYISELVIGILMGIIGSTAFWIMLAVYLSRKGVK